MPYLGCKSCHHEFEGKEDDKCDWCGADTEVFERETPLEKLCKDPDKIVKILKEMEKTND